jgi:hypothetical protein
VNVVGAGVLPTIDTVPLPQLADLHQDGDLEGAARGALVDLDGDGKPESISAAGNEITVRSADAQKLRLDGWPQLAGTFAWSVDVVVGDVNNDTRLERQALFDVGKTTGRRHRPAADSLEAGAQV